MNFAEVELMIAELRDKIGGFPAAIEDYVSRLLADKPDEVEQAPESIIEAAPIQPTLATPSE